MFSSGMPAPSDATIHPSLMAPAIICDGSTPARACRGPIVVSLPLRIVRRSHGRCQGYATPRPAARVLARAETVVIAAVCARGRPRRRLAPGGEADCVVEAGAAGAGGGTGGLGHGRRLSPRGDVGDDLLGHP